MEAIGGGGDFVVFLANTQPWCRSLMDEVLKCRIGKLTYNLRKYSTDKKALEVRQHGTKDIISKATFPRIIYYGYYITGHNMSQYDCKILYIHDILQDFSTRYHIWSYNLIFLLVLLYFLHIP